MTGTPVRIRITKTTDTEGREETRLVSFYARD